MPSTLSANVTTAKRLRYSNRAVNHNLDCNFTVKVLSGSLVGNMKIKGSMLSDPSEYQLYMLQFYCEENKFCSIQMMKDAIIA